VYLHDDRTARHVHSVLPGRWISRARPPALSRAVDAARAADLSLDDTALRTVESAGDAFENNSRAIVDLPP
jgi:hypothetical protein